MALLHITVPGGCTIVAGKQQVRAVMRGVGADFVSAAVIGPRRMKRSTISKKRILLPRPFLEPALDQAIANGLADRVRVAVMSGLKFQRGKQ